MDFRKVFSNSVVVTGGVASGKSTICEMLRDQGFTVQSADEIVRELWTLDDTHRAVAKSIGWKLPLDMQTLKREVFLDPILRARINKVFHGPVLERLGNTPCEVIEIPLAFETCVFGFFPAIVTVVCTRDEQIQRLKKRNHSNSEIEAILSSQLSEIPRIVGSDYEIRTSHSNASVHEATEKLGLQLRDVVF